MLKAVKTVDFQSRSLAEFVSLIGLLGAAMTSAYAQPAVNSVRIFPSPITTDLAPADPSMNGGQEHITVFGKRPFFQKAPLPNYDERRAPWETDKAIRDTMTGSNTTAFGNAYNLGSQLGSDERNNETGGQFVAPRHN